MKIFVTGASGWIGSAVIPELLANGHRVLGLARSDASASRVKALGAEVQRGELADLRSLKEGAAASDGVIHLGFVHDFSNLEASIGIDRKAIDAFGEALAGTDKPFCIASGTMMVAPGQLATEEATARDNPFPRHANALATLELAKRGVRSIVMRLPPTVHGKGDHGFIKFIVDIARKTGVSGYPGDGANRWNAVHRLDAARLFRLAIEKAPAGSILHAVAEEAITSRRIAEVIGEKLRLPVKSVAAEHFDWIGRFFSMDQAASSALTRQRMGWTPTQPGLIEDLEQGHYFG
jgi:nucleoside-diphosphate-sugar epimerase